MTAERFKQIKDLYESTRKGLNYKDLGVVYAELYSALPELIEALEKEEVLG